MTDNAKLRVGIFDGTATKVDCSGKCNGWRQDKDKVRKSTLNWPFELHVPATFVKTHLAGEEGKIKIVIEEAQSEKEWSFLLDVQGNLGKISGIAWKELVQQMDIDRGDLCALEWVKGDNLFYFHILEINHV
ncbi:OLC1v1016288C1 [Oldenlandia corymbosa var. corymbosa]|uniref:OLC1v1016288C1 n=1 Tax=Oldenlandia corymbosa var. corymbosa TaxID=529605 RepID=A0AAV1E5C7_OLDCO|nr:OLC1v1016288C1 [Oldenlandia corymbosa var. corymbosa]